MRRFFLILVMLLTFKCFSYEEFVFYPEGNFEFTSRNFGPYYLSGFSFKEGIIYGFEKNELEGPLGSVEKLNEWTRAYAYKVGDVVVASHHAYLLSAGTLLDCLKMYEIHDENNQVIGYIEGIWETDTAACFFFYKENRELVAKAILDSSYSTLRISSPNDEILITGEKTLYVPQYSESYFPSQYYWIVKQEREPSLNASFLWPFMAFLSEAWWN